MSLSDWENHPIHSWVEAVDIKGKRPDRVYWYNRVTRTRQWKAPACYTAEIAETPYPWIKKVSKTHHPGQVFWFNHQTKSTVWVRPQPCLPAEEDISEKSFMPPFPEAPAEVKENQRQEKEQFVVVDSQLADQLRTESAQTPAPTPAPGHRTVEQDLDKISDAKTVKAQILNWVNNPQVQNGERYTDDELDHDDDEKKGEKKAESDDDDDEVVHDRYLDAPDKKDEGKQKEKDGPGFGIRAVVSKKKRRYTEHGFDLDLSYITPQIIAMGFPSEGHQALYRNPMGEVQRFLNTRHKSNYKVYNLCAERGYPPTRFNNSFAAYPFMDHNPPRFCELPVFCEDVTTFFASGL
jgi:hypothetical protein